MQFDIIARAELSRISSVASNSQGLLIWVMLVNVACYGVLFAVVVIESARSGESVSWIWCIAIVLLGAIFSNLPKRRARVQAFAEGVEMSNTELTLMYALIAFPAALTVFAILQLTLNGSIATIQWILIFDGYLAGKSGSDYLSTKLF